MPSLFHSLPFKAGVCVLVTGIAVAIGVLRTAPEPKAPADPLAARLASADTTTMTVRRAAFCDALTASAPAALGSAVASRTSWKPGDRTRLAPHVKDVADEYGCSWTSASGAEARAWVFAPPVTTSEATGLVKPAKGCTAIDGAPAFGSPSGASVCGKATRTATYHGLFGDAWLSCSVGLPKASADQAALLDRAGKWCVAVAKAASSG